MRVLKPSWSFARCLILFAMGFESVRRRSEPILRLHGQVQHVSGRGSIADGGNGTYLAIVSYVKGRARGRESDRGKRDERGREEGAERGYESLDGKDMRNVRSSEELCEVALARLSR